MTPAAAAPPSNTDGPSLPSPSSPHKAANNSRTANGAFPDPRRHASVHNTGVRPRKSGDELGKLPEKQTWIEPLAKPTLASSNYEHKNSNDGDISPHSQRRRAKLRSPWACSTLTCLASLLAAVLATVIARSYITRQLDPKGAAMSYMRPSFVRFPEFDTEHTRFASKYSLYLYREGGIDEDPRVKGIPALFIPGNAGSYKQVRPVAAEAAVYFQEQLSSDDEAMGLGKRPLDFFTVDFNEDITAFHGQTMLDQAEYLNEAVAYILALYHSPSRSLRDPDLPDPTSVIILGHSMGGIVARTMLTMPNYQANSINTIITLAAPHARPPVSFDADIVRTYKTINDFWRHSYSQTRREQNPLAGVALISIAGGGLDTIVPSDYATLASLVPPTNGFTVFTSTIPRVWTGMDHLAITWCDQLRKSIARALYDVIDASRPNQTRVLPDRMRAFKRHFLSGMEDIVEKSLEKQSPDTLLTLQDEAGSIISQGKRLVLNNIGSSNRAEAHLLPVPPQESTERRRFTLLSSSAIGQSNSGSNLEVLLCSVLAPKSGRTNQVFRVSLDLSGGMSGSTRLACKDAAADSIALPASTESSQHPFDEARPFSYLEYGLEDLSEHQFIAVVENATQSTNDWVFAEISSETDSSNNMNKGLRNLILTGADIDLPPNRPLMNAINIPSLYSSLLAYSLKIRRKSCPAVELFAPLVRQYIPDPYESKYFVNVKDAEISMHGVAPYMPPALQAPSSAQGLTLQIWSDPTCNRTMEVSLKVDIVGSMGKLWMRYRTVFAAFPLIVVALALRKQFQFYDATGVFMSFSESMDQCLRRSVPVLMVALTFLAVSFSRASQASTKFFGIRNGPSETPIDFTVNDLLLGSQDPFFWFLIPLFGLISIGTCIVLNYAVLSLTFVSSFCASALARYSVKDQSKSATIFSNASPQKRIITTTILLVLASTIIPYQFVFMVLCIVQLITCVRALRLAQETHTGDHMNFYNYTHSILMLMLWITPINVPVLVVWIRNLALHWLTPFSSHHNILSIMPFVVLVETLSTGKMVPRITSRVRQFTRILFFALSIYAAVYGVTYAYLLHHIVNIICAWLSALHASNSSMASWPIRRFLGGSAESKSGAAKSSYNKCRPARYQALFNNVERYHASTTSASHAANGTRHGLKLRPYQEECVLAVLEAFKEGRRQVGVSLATGSGKTVIFTELIERTEASHKNATQTLILVHRRELVEQAARHCSARYPEKSVEIEMGNLRASGVADITIASVQSINSKDRIDKFDSSRFKLILVDEAHHIVASSYLRVLEHFGLGLDDEDMDKPALVGVSATFSRHDGLALGKAIKHIVYHRDYVDMIEQNWLCNVIFTTVRLPADLSKVKTSPSGDFQTSSLSEAVNTPEFNEITVRSWLARANDRRSTLVFCVDVQHLVDLTATFHRHGVDARFVTGMTPNSDRSETVEAFKERKFPVLLNCGVFTEGTDIPNIDCVLICRPTRSRNLLVQMIGRGVRLFKGKDDCHVLDMVASLEEGIVTTPTLFGLDPNEMADAEDLTELRERKRIKDEERQASDACSVDLSHVNIGFTDYDSVVDLIADTSSERHVRAISQFAWVAITDTKLVLANGAKGDYIVVEDKPVKSYKVHSHKTDDVPRFFVKAVASSKSLPPGTTKGNSPYLRPRQIAAAPTLESAIRAADTYAADHFTRMFIVLRGAQARWRDADATQAQVDFLNTFCEQDDERLRTDSLSKGQASDMLTKLKHGAKTSWKVILQAKQRRAREVERRRKQVQKIRDLESLAVGPLDDGEMHIST
ncbi:MAG: hypothetical protein Q9162_002623 [Coniocarpon cinnabarinum]